MGSAALCATSIRTRRPPLVGCAPPPLVSFRATHPGSLASRCGSSSTPSGYRSACRGRSPASPCCVNCSESIAYIPALRCGPPKLFGRRCSWIADDRSSSTTGEPALAIAHVHPITLALVQLALGHPLRTDAKQVEVEYIRPGCDLRHSMALIVDDRRRVRLRRRAVRLADNDCRSLCVASPAPSAAWKPNQSTASARITAPSTYIATAEPGDPGDVVMRRAPPTCASAEASRGQDTGPRSTTPGSTC